MILLSDIYFVIVLYKTELANCESFISLSNDKTSGQRNISLLVYDNSPDRQDMEKSMGFWNIDYIHDKENSGLSKAYNIGAKKAQSIGKKLIFLLDQDTIFPENSLNTYLKSINDHSDINLFAPILRVKNGKIMSPCKYIKKWGKFIDKLDPGIYRLNNYVPVNSGLCIDLEAFQAVGGYNESVKLDGADFQFIERLKKKYDRFCVLNIEAFQNFSMFDDDNSKIIIRYKMFLDDISNFETFQRWDKLYYLRIALIRTFFVLKQTRNPIVIKYFFAKFRLTNY